jgi:hypothetical protein
LGGGLGGVLGVDERVFVLTEAPSRSTLLLLFQERVIHFQLPIVPLQFS